MIGRIKEQDLLRRLAKSGESEFVAVYGRRRVGKTYLVRDTFEGEFTFTHSGLSRTNMRGQLHAFRNSLKAYGNGKCPAFTNWLDAFEELKKVIGKGDRAKKIVFIDEMPWMDTPRSGFVTALEFFWNSWASARRDVLLIVCGSATSWIIDKIIRSHGGLHNRVTEQISLEPFTLAECEAYAESRALGLSRRQIAELYMALGGVPYYWHFLERGASAAQSIDELFFAGNAKLKNEFGDLYDSLFRTSEPYLAIVRALGENAGGLNRDELSKAAGIPTGGHFTKYLEELEQCGFIAKSTAFGKRVNDSVFRLIDNFTLFYFRFISVNRDGDRDFWMRSLGTGRYHEWRGHAFERLCFRHVDCIKRALQIGGVSAKVCAYRDEETEIDMIIDRRDDVIDLCEMKCTDEPYRIDGSEVKKLARRRSALQKLSKGAKAVHTVLVSASGLEPGKWSGEVVHTITLDDLFQHQT